MNLGLPGLVTLLALAPESRSPCPPLGAPPQERGMALGLFSKDPGFRYRALLEEVAAIGASHVSLVWVWWQDRLDSVDIRPRPGWSATSAQLLEAVRDARALGLHVTVFPILRLAEPGPGEWRGKIAPRDEDAWWESYDAYILEAAAIAAHAGAQRLSVGSELLTREGMRARWARLVDRLRLRHPGLELLYSANWDHFWPVRFWDLVDVVGVTAYWEVGRGPDDPVEDLVAAWAAPTSALAALAAAVGRPVVVTEIGYPSLVGGTRWPWDETRRAPVDLEEQRRGYEAYARALSGRPVIQGSYWWNWFGFGGDRDGDYTPRGKPAEQLIRCWYRPARAPVSRARDATLP